MTFESDVLRPNPSLPRTRLSSWALSVGVALVAVASAATAQTTAAPVRKMDWSMLVARLDAKAIGVIVVAVLILLLLIWRVARMIRRDRIVAQRVARRRPAASVDDFAPRTTTQPAMDWGFDQNKRAAVARTPSVSAPGAELPSLDMTTQWSMTDVQKAHGAGFQTDDALGKSPNQAPSPYRTSFNPYFKGDQVAQRGEVVEVADTLLQAELLVQLGDPKQAMTLLSHHIRDTERPGPAAWLMLLNLYQSTGRESQYNALAAGFKALFNAQVPAWASSSDAASRDLETYLQVVTKLQTTWSTGQAHGALEGLLNDDRGGSRQGFSITAYRELLFLVEILGVLEEMANEDEERSGIRRKLDATS